MQWKLGIESCALTQLDPCLVILKPQHVVVKNCLQIHLIRGDLAGAIEAARQAQQVPHLYGIVKHFDVRHRWAGLAPARGTMSDSARSVEQPLELHRRPCIRHCA